jgi:hypothetical protein
MNPTIIVAGIGAMALILVAVINGYVAKKVAETSAKVTEVGNRVDGRMDELLELTRQASHAEGVKDQKIISTEEAVRVSGTKSITKGP